MNRLEQFFIQHVLLHSPFGATNFYPYDSKGITAEVTDSLDDQDDVSLNIYDNYFSVKTGTTVKFEIGNNDVAVVRDYRERPGHTPGADIETSEGVISLSPENKSVYTKLGYFLYLVHKLSR